MSQKYLGIIPYGDDGNFEFVGRSDETWALYDRIIRNEYTVYYAASGEGKSSLIRAGLLPILRRRDFFPVYIVFEDKELDNLSSIDEFLVNRIELEISKYHNVSYEQSSWSKSRFDTETSENLKDNLWWRIRNYCFKRGDTELKPLFIFDQFEEVFTKASYEWTDRFFTWLEEISTDYLPDFLRESVNSWGVDVPTQKNFKALFSFRTEYLGDLDYWSVQKHFIPSLQENRMCLKPLTPKGARDVINLNESSLGKYADKIIDGCAEAKTNINSDDQPCVYALILSVVCQTLSEIPDKERVFLLENLKNNKDETINDILLKFYKKKLKEVGLDYIKNEDIIANLENALVDEKGKRCRRDTDELSMLPLSKWIEKLCGKENGLLKIIASKDVNGLTINTVEFPHDRLCKAIDTSRKERQGRIAWKLKRQREWMSFGVITVVVAIIAFLWNALMPSIKPVIVNALYSKEGSAGVKKQLLDNYLAGNHSEYEGYSLDEGFSTLFLMITSILFIPLITIFISRINKKWQILSSVVSSFCVFLYGFLWYRNLDITFLNSYVYVFTVIFFLGSLVCLGVSILNMRNILFKGEIGSDHSVSSSNWPLFGGYFIFASYLFYECLYRITFGISEPCDSTWALIVLPLLFTMWAWGFFNMVINKNRKTRIIFVYIASCILLFLLFYISNLPYYNISIQISKFIASIILIILWIIANSYILWSSQSNSKYYVLSKSKCLFVTLFGTLVIIVTFILNLGYNPIAISPSKVCHVASWRDVLVLEHDSIGNKKYGILYASNGDTIIPYCIHPNVDTDSLLLKGEHPFQVRGHITIETNMNSSPFEEDAVLQNIDGSLRWNPSNHKLTSELPLASTLEQYLHDKLNKGLSKNSTIKDSIDYYAANLFVEMRKANILYSTKGISYNLNALPSLGKLDSLQHIALSKELSKFSLLAMDTTIASSGWKLVRPKTEVVQDEHLVDFHCELSRSFLLCMIKDRAIQSDMPSMFTLATYYIIAYFTSVPGMNMRINYREDSNITLNIDDNKTFVKKDKSYHICSDDILNKRLFAWYHLFDAMCGTDISSNSSTFVSVYSSGGDEFLDSLKVIYKELQTFNDSLSDFNKRLTSISDTIKNSDNVATSTSLLLDAFKDYDKLKNTKNAKFESILARIENLDLTIKSLAVDESLRNLKEDVFNTLLPIMEKYETCIYNNCFESICKNLILVLSFRGNEVKNDIDKLSNYLKEKNNVYSLNEKLHENINKINFERMQMKKELEDSFRTSIKR